MKIDKPIHNVEARKTVVINQSLATSNTFTFPLYQHLHFTPRYMIIRSILYANIAGADLGTYLIYSDLTSNNIGAFYVGIQANSHFPETTLQIVNPISQIIFTITPANTAFTGPTGQLTMTLEFVA
jgi:hypothetical protein